MVSSTILPEFQNIPVWGPRWLKMVKIDIWRSFGGRIPEMEASSFALDERGEVSLTFYTCLFPDASISEVTMPDHRQVPQIAKGPQQFRKEDRVPIPSPMMQRLEQQAAMAPSPPQSAEEAIAESMADMAMEIYCRLVVSAGSSADSSKLREMADYARTAAKAYFESMGVQFDG